MYLWIGDTINYKSKEGYNCVDIITSMFKVKDGKKQARYQCRCLYKDSILYLSGGDRIKIKDIIKLVKRGFMYDEKVTGIKRA